MTLTLKDALKKYFAENYLRFKDKIDESYLKDTPFLAENCSNCKKHVFECDVHYCTLEGKVKIDNFPFKQELTPEEADDYLDGVFTKSKIFCKTDSYDGVCLDPDEIIEWIKKRDEIISSVTNGLCKNKDALIKYAAKKEAIDAKFKVKTLDSFRLRVY